MASPAQAKISDFFKTRVKRPRSPTAVDLKLDGSSKRVKTQAVTLQIDSISGTRRKLDFNTAATARSGLHEDDDLILPKAPRGRKSRSKKVNPPIFTPISEVFMKIISKEQQSADKAAQEPNGNNASHETMCKGPSKPVPLEGQHSTRRPAHVRFSHLLDTPSSPSKDLTNSPTRSPTSVIGGLSLPPAYEHLLESFRGCDTVLSMLASRKDVATYSKIRSAVEEMSKRDFSMSTLAAIVTVFPAAYKLHYEFRLGSREDCLPLIVSFPQGKMSPSDLLLRRKLFTKALIDMAKVHHKDFLESLDPPIDIAVDDVKRWHPRFRLDKVPPVQANECLLPQRPSFVDQTETAEQVLSRVAPVPLSPFKSPKKSDGPMPESPKRITSGALKGLSSSLLDKIRAKEVTKLARELTRQPETERELRIIDRLPQLIRVIHTLCVSERKAVIPYALLIERMEQSLEGHLSRPDIEEHVSCLMRILPGWLLKLNVTKGTFIRIDKSVQLSCLETRIHLHKKTLTQSHAD